MYMCCLEVTLEAIIRDYRGYPKIAQVDWLNMDLCVPILEVLVGKMDFYWLNFDDTLEDCISKSPLSLDLASLLHQVSVYQIHQRLSAVPYMRYSMYWN